MTTQAMLGALAIAGGVLVACGSVAGSDPSFWQPAQGFAGAQGQFIAGQNYSGGAPAMAPTDTNGNPIPPPPGAGGYVPGAGGYVPGGGVPNSGSGGAPPFGGTPGTGGDITGGGFTSTGGTQAGTGGDPQPPPTTTDTGPAPPPPPPPTPGSKCSFRFDVTTVSYGGRFHPQNVGAIYIENSSAGYVKSLNVWGGTRLGNLTDWETLSGGDKTDAVTSATRSNAGPISGSWDCTDKSRNPVPTGQYKVCCSFQEDDALPFFGPAPKQACVGFTVGSGPFTQNAPDQQYFKSMTLTMQ